MDRSVTLTRALYVAAGVLTLLAGAVQLAWRAPESSSAAEASSVGALLPAAPPAIPTARNIEPMDSRAINAIAAANVFSPARVAPRKRYVATSSGDLTNADTGASAPAASPVIRLFGITITPTTAHALIEADPMIPGAEVYRVGDQVRRSRLVELSESTAVLDGPDGRHVLRLRSSSRTQRPE